MPCSPSCLSPLPPPPIRVMYKAAIRLCLSSLLLLWPPPPPPPPLWLVMDFHRLPFIPPLLPDYLILAKVKKKKGGSPFFSPPQPRSSTTVGHRLPLPQLPETVACLPYVVELEGGGVGVGLGFSHTGRRGRMKKKQAGKQGGRGGGVSAGTEHRGSVPFGRRTGEGKERKGNPDWGGGVLS